MRRRRIDRKTETTAMSTDVSIDQYLSETPRVSSYIKYPIPPPTLVIQDNTPPAPPSAPSPPHDEQLSSVKKTPVSVIRQKVEVLEDEIVKMKEMLSLILESRTNKMIDTLLGQTNRELIHLFEFEKNSRYNLESIEESQMEHILFLFSMYKNLLINNFVLVSMK